MVCRYEPDELRASFIDNPLRAEAKSGRGVFGKSLDMSFERSRRQTVIGIEKHQVVPGTPFEAESFWLPRSHDSLCATLGRHYFPEERNWQAQENRRPRR